MEPRFPHSKGIELLDCGCPVPLCYAIVRALWRCSIGTHTKDEPRSSTRVEQIEHCGEMGSSRQILFVSQRATAWPKIEQMHMQQGHQKQSEW
jgi:hypothetical protein